MSVDTPPPTRRGAETFQRLWERLDLAAYLVLIVLAAPIIADLLTRAWLQSRLIREAVFSLERATGIDHLQLALIGIGFVLGLLVLMWIDHMKRVQAFLLTVAVVLVLWTFSVRGIIFRIPLVPNLQFIAGGFVSGILAGGGRTIRKERPPWEFRRATLLLVAINILLVLIALAEVYLLHELPGIETSGRADGVSTAAVTVVGSSIFVDVLASGVYLAAIYGFTTYEVDANVLWLGGSRDGKTTGNMSLYEAAKRRARRIATRLNPSAPLSEMYESFTSADWGWGEHVGPNKKGEYEVHRFTTRRGELFKENLNVEAIDYAGEYLSSRLASIIESLAPDSRLSIQWVVVCIESVLGLPNLPERATNLDDKGVYRTLAKKIIHSDTLLLTIDAGLLLEERPEWAEADHDGQRSLAETVSAYVQIIRHLDQSVLAEKDYVLVVTKADYLVPLYKRANTHLTFDEWVNFYLLEQEEGQQKLGALVGQADIDRVYPVFYEIDEEASKEAGEPMPDHPIQTHGAEALLERLKR